LEEKVKVAVDRMGGFGPTAARAGKVHEPVAPVHNDYMPNSTPPMVREVFESAEADNG
jgi:hypothetical protein